jgi:hypothetical protein
MVGFGAYDLGNVVADSGKGGLQESGVLPARWGFSLLFRFPHPPGRVYRRHKAEEAGVSGWGMGPYGLSLGPTRGPY